MTAIIKREANFGTLFRHWLRANPMSRSCAFELKQTQTDSLPFSAVKDHQLAALVAVHKEGLLYKAPDDSRGIKPFDFFYLIQAQPYVVIRYPKCFVLIYVKQFIEEKEKSDRKSLTVTRAKQIAAVCVDL